MTPEPAVGAVRAPAVGNDVVDLDDRRCAGKASDRRFLDRVLAAGEREAVRAAADPDLALWTRWAAKEAAFKAATVVRGAPPVFEHAAFEVQGEGPAGGTVRWEGLTFPWRLSGGRAEGGVHVVAWWADAPGGVRVEGGTARTGAGPRISLEGLLERFSERERPAVHSLPSAWVRLHARAHLAALAAVEEARLEIVSPPGAPGRTPPRVLVDGEPSRWRVGLSHHGTLLGWVLARRPEEGEGDGPVTAPPVAQRPGGR